MPERKPIALVDIDGTLADVRHRLHYIQDGQKDWEGFFREMVNDTPINAVVLWVQNLSPEYEIVLLTGRPEDYRSETETWLRKHAIAHSRLFMRRSGDRRPDYIMKSEILREIPKEQIAFVIEDRPQVCRMWKENGLRCFQVASDEENQLVNEVYQEKPERSD